METDGSLTVLKAQGYPKPAGLSQSVIVDGKQEREVMKSRGWDEYRLRLELARRGYGGPGEVFLATLDEQGRMTIFPREPDAAGPVIRH